MLANLCVPEPLLNIVDSAFQPVQHAVDFVKFVFFEFVPVFVRSDETVDLDAVNSSQIYKSVQLGV